MKNENTDFRTVSNLLLRHFLITKSNKEFEYNPLKFLKVDSSNKEKILIFCQENHYVPPEISGKDFFESFEIEQKAVDSIISSYEEHYKKGETLESAELELINNRISNIKTHLALISEKKLKNVNDSLGKNPNVIRKKRYIIQNHMGPSNEQLWLNIAFMILREQRVSECKNCACYFTVSHSKKNQLYCSPECENQYRQNRFRAKQKKLKM